MIDEMKEVKPEDCLAVGGGMGEITRNSEGVASLKLEWPNALAVPVSTWLQTLLSIILASRFSVLLQWGTEYAQFYNDGFRRILDVNQHPRAMRQAAYPWRTEFGYIISSISRRLTLHFLTVSFTTIRSVLSVLSNLLPNPQKGFLTSHAYSVLRT